MYNSKILLILIVGLLDYALTGGNCVEKRHENLHRLFVCTIAMQAKKNAEDFFPNKNFGAFFSLYPQI